jgi:hypothetical protein
MATFAQVLDPISSLQTQIPPSPDVPWQRAAAGLLMLTGLLVERVINDSHGFCSGTM